MCLVSTVNVGTFVGPHLSQCKCGHKCGHVDIWPLPIRQSDQNKKNRLSARNGTARNPESTVPARCEIAIPRREPWRGRRIRLRWPVWLATGHVSRTAAGCRSHKIPPGRRKNEGELWEPALRRLSKCGKKLLCGFRTRRAPVGRQR
eukprot:scaffold6519_cov101-Isochrysis_galbana.AAC.2